MFNPANLATEIFGILRSFDYVVNIFDFDGNRVYEPAEARRFFASPKNITVSIHEDGENSSIKMFLSKSTDISEVEGLISTMRVTASKFGVLFNVRKYERELRPKDLAPNGASEYDAGISLKNAAETPTKPSMTTDDPEIPVADTPKHSPKTDKLENIGDEVAKLNSSFKKIAGLIHDKKKVKETMNIDNNTLNEGVQTIRLKALGMDVEDDAWTRFRKGYLKFSELPDLDVTDEDASTFASQYADTHDGMAFDHSTAIKAVELDRIIKEIRKPTPLLAAVLSKCLSLFTTGAAGTFINAMVDQALKCRAFGDNEDGSFQDVPDHDGKTPEKKDLVTLKEFRGKVERQAWQDFTNDYIEFSAPVDLSNVKVGASANKMSLYLHLIANKTVAPGLANLFTVFADDIADGRATPFKNKVAAHAIEIAQHGKVKVGESIIMSESIREFADWFDSLSSTKLFEGHDDFPYDDKDDRAFDLAWKTVKDDFDPMDFLDTSGKEDFYWGDDNEDKTVDYSEVKSSLRHYIKGELDRNLEDEYPDSEDVGKLVDDLMPSVKETMTEAGWTVDEADPITEDDASECTKDDCVLKTEDVLLPSRPDDDLAREVTAPKDTKDMDRIIALARGNSASWSPRTPQP